VRVAAVLGVMLMAATTGGSSPAAAARYEIDHARSEIVAKVFKSGPASAFAHDHVVRATRWQATLDLSSDPVALSADVRVDATGLAVDEPEVRARYDLADTLSDDDRAQVRASMLGADQLDVAAFPEMRFVVTRLERAEDGFRIVGELTVHGVTRHVARSLSITPDGDAFVARGQVRIRQSDFGIQPYSAFLGAVRTQNEVEIVFALVAVPAVAR
jgi:polyisoprenoid-binding protein YceI